MKKRNFRLILVCIAGLIVLCAAAVGKSALSNLALPAHSEVTDRLFVCAYHGNRLVGFLNLACDGGYHGVAYHLTSIN